MFSAVFLMMIVITNCPLTVVVGGPLGAHQNIHGIAEGGNQPNVVMQSVVLGKKPKTTEEIPDEDEPRPPKVESILRLLRVGASCQSQEPEPIDEEPPEDPDDKLREIVKLLGRMMLNRSPSRRDEVDSIDLMPRCRLRKKKPYPLRSNCQCQRRKSRDRVYTALLGDAYDPSEGEEEEQINEDSSLEERYLRKLTKPRKLYREEEADFEERNYRTVPKRQKSFKYEVFPENRRRKWKVNNSSKKTDFEDQWTGDKKRNSDNTPQDILYIPQFGSSGSRRRNDNISTEY